MSNSDCIFCKIASGEIPSKKVYEDARTFAFHDLSPQGPVHVLVIPKAHYASVLEMEDDALMGHLCAVACNIAREYGMDENGFRLVVNTGKDGGQSVSHLHIHLLGGRAFGWPPG